MKKLRWQLVIILLTGLVVGILLITQQPAGVTPTAPEPTEGGVYTEGLVGAFNRLNPLLDGNNPADRDIDRLIFSGLIRFDSRGTPQPDLAADWGVSQDGTVYNVSIREEAAWHDGEPVTADDVIFTIEMLREGEGFVPEDLRSFWQEIEVKRMDDRIVQFLLPEAFAPFLDYLTFGLLPAHILGDLSAEELIDAPFNLAPVGTGPYRFQQLMVDGDLIRGVMLAAFENHYLKEPFIQQMVFRYYPDSAAALDAYRAGEVQGIGEVTSDALPGVLAEPELALYSARLPRLAIVLLNLNNPDVEFFQEPEVRHALMMGLNRQWLIDHALAGQGIVADGPLFPGTWAYYDGLERVKFDSEAATEVLKDKGFVLTEEGGAVRQREETRLAFTLLYPEDPQYAEIAEAIQRDWGRLGAAVELEAIPYEDLVSARLADRDYDAALVSLNLTRSPDPDPYPFWDQAQASSGQNYSQWDDRNASEYIERARVARDLEERARLYRNFQMIFAQEMPALPLFYPVYNFAIDRQVQGVQMGPLIDPSDRFATVTDWFLVARRAAEPTPTSEP